MSTITKATIAASFAGLGVGAFFLSISSTSVGASPEEALKAIQAKAQMDAQLETQINAHPPLKPRAQISDAALTAIIDQRINFYFENKANLAFQSLEATYLGVEENTQKSDFVYGNPDAPITLIEFSDFSCPYCKSFHDTPKQLVKATNGEVNWTFKHFPLSFHDPVATNQAMAAECAGTVGNNRKFWMMTDALFESGASSVNDYIDLANKLRIPEKDFRDCLNNPEIRARVNASVAFGTQVGVTGTPASFLVHSASGKMLKMSGVVPPEQLQAGVRRLKEMVREEAEAQAAQSAPIVSDPAVVQPEFEAGVQ
jgi:protein-disulfide isomerase